MITKSTFLTTVMYHYVRPVAQSDFPRLKGLELRDFISQLDHLQAEYSIIGPHDLRLAVTEAAPLPPRPCLLTFDDGYADHYRHVFPVLAERGLSGLFFAPRSSLIGRRMLEVNKIQFTLASHSEPEALADDIEVLLADEGIADIAALRAAHFAPNRYDGPGVAYVKRLLQHVLPPDLRTLLTDQLFRRHVSSDDTAFAEELYLTPDQAREMRSAGMEFGGHGDLHLWHGEVTPQELAQEIEGASAALSAKGAPVEGGFYSYTFGSENKAVRTGVSTAGLKLGFTVQPDLWSIEGDPLMIARLDTNDLPRQHQPHCPWRARVA